MRTTVTIDPDVEVLLERAMRETGASFKQVLNNAVREGLRASASKSNRAGQAYRQPVFDMGVPAVDLAKATELAGELEDVELIEKLRRGR